MQHVKNPQNGTVFNELNLNYATPFKNQIWWHILFWVSFVVYEGLIWSTVDGAYDRRLTTSVIELPVKVLATYFTLYVLIDKFLIKKKYILFLFSLPLSMVFFGIMLRVLAYYTIYPMYYPDALDVPLFFPPKILIAIFSIYSLVAIVVTFHLIKIWYSNQQATQLLQQRAQRLQHENMEAELKLLKSQINPHFLFNTLNNLYVLSLNNSEKAPEMIHKLSELMSYMLYESNQKEVPLKNEVRYIQNYIALERIRYESRLDISLNIFDDIEGIYIAPLLLLPFVENSFKHGVSNQIVKGWIRIDLILKEKTLVIKVENSKSVPDKEKSVRLTSGIGLQNVRKRLKLIYPDQHRLHLYDEEDTFLSVLKIELDPEALSNRELLKDKTTIAI